MFFTDQGHLFTVCVRCNHLTTHTHTHQDIQGSEHMQRGRGASWHQVAPYPSGLNSCGIILSVYSSPSHTAFSCSQRKSF